MWILRPRPRRKRVRKFRFGEAQIVAILKELKWKKKVPSISRERGISEATPRCVCWPCFGGQQTVARSCTSLPGQTGTERVHRKLQRLPSRRMFERARPPFALRGAADPRGLAHPIQHRATSRFTRLEDARGIRCNLHDYSTQQNSPRIAGGIVGIASARQTQ
jgi:hypothetical protein